MIRAIASFLALSISGCAAITGTDTSATAGMGSYSYSRYNSQTGDYLEAKATSGRDVSGVDITFGDDGTAHIKIENLDGTAAQAKMLDAAAAILERVVPAP